MLVIFADFVRFERRKWRVKWLASITDSSSALIISTIIRNLTNDGGRALLVGDFHCARIQAISLSNGARNSGGVVIGRRNWSAENQVLLR